MKHILVCYATRYGSTASVAKIIGQELETAGFRVTVQPLTAVSDPSGYDAVIIGSPLYMGKWLAEARDFVSRFRHALKVRPVAVFSVGYSLREMTHDVVKSGEDALESVRIFCPPIDAGFFPGKIDLGPLSPTDTAVIRLSGVTPGDFRDTEKVRAWTHNLAKYLDTG